MTKTNEAHRHENAASRSERLRRLGELLRSGHGARGKTSVIRALTRERWRSTAHRDVIAVPMADLGGQRIYVRPQTTDLANAASYFSRSIHRPPPSVRDPRRIVELGTNMGAGLTALALAHPEARLVGVEPDPGNLAIASLNTARFGDRVRLVQAAIWDTDADLVLEPGSVGEHGFTIRPRLEEDAGAGRLAALTIDALLERSFPGEEVDYMHVTIEGSEPRVFAAGGAWPERVRALRVEAHPYLDYSVAACAAQLEALGYVTAPVPDPPGKWVFAWRP